MFIKISVVVGAASVLPTGVWMRIDPAGFAAWANWPNHVHFLHDLAVFHIGIGLMMLAALWWRDVIAVVLAGYLVTNTLHAINHLLDQHMGGRESDWWLLGLFSVLAAAALAVRLRGLRRGQTV
ncbi:hypothetical protein [Nonomuraea sp. NPDC049480]|uniref:hypothetical protein n=1 Tax=Nonomuraea sp. NPDC049480 TaxID=3364353 RepID=UPI0037B40326